MPSKTKRRYDHPNAHRCQLLLKGEDKVTMVNVVVVRGVVEVGDEAGDKSHERGRSTALPRLRRYGVGKVVALPSLEAARLQKLGIVKAI